MTKKLKKIINSTIDFLKDEWKFIVFCLVLTIILLYPMDYYITTGGGIININDRVKIEDAYKSKGSLNITYVSQLKGDVLTYGLSYIVPNWEREKYSDYLVNKDDTIEDVDFRYKLDLKRSNSNAIYWGYKLANKEVSLKSNKIYVVYVYNKNKSKFKVQDRIISLDGNKFDELNDYIEYINSVDVGEKIEVEVLRDKKKIKFKSKVYEEKGKHLLGIVIEEIKEYTTDKKIEFKFRGNESGSSGGLITTLDIYNKLTKKDITNGLNIAGTGTIEADGSIGEIGGVNYKVIGAAKGKADVFLTPKDNYDECIKTVKEKKLKIKVIKVNNIEDAVNKLNNYKG